MFEAHICNCVNLRRAANKITEYYDHMLKPHHITTAQFTMLATLYQDRGINTTKLAEKMFLDRTTVIRNLKVLIDRGYVIKTTRKRVNELELSQKGHEVFKLAYRDWKIAQQNYEQYLGKANLELLRDLLVKTANLEGV